VDTGLTRAQAIAGLDMEKVIYFAQVVGGAQQAADGKRDDRVIDIGLEKYYEPLRKFLVGDQAFPVCMVFIHWISSLEGESLVYVMLPRRSEYVGCVRISLPFLG